VIFNILQIADHKEKQNLPGGEVGYKNRGVKQSAFRHGQNRATLDTLYSPVVRLDLHKLAVDSATMRLHVDKDRMFHSNGNSDYVERCLHKIDFKSNEWKTRGGSSEYSPRLEYNHF